MKIISKKIIKYRLFSLIIVGLFFPLLGFSQWTELHPTSIEIIEKSSDQLKKAAQVFQEEIFKRSSINLPIHQAISSSKESQTIIILTEANIQSLAISERNELSKLEKTRKDGYKIKLIGNLLIILGHDDRGCLYGVGKVMREMKIVTNQLFIQSNFQLSSSPTYPIRGHQLGYRPKTNAYDAWTVAQYDQYIRDLAIFGANSIEIMPSRTDDDSTSVHMKLPASEMIKEQSRICAAYGLDVWIWYPNMAKTYSTAESIKVELEEREAVFSSLLKLDAVFVPGGDPGDLEPDELFDWLAKEAKILIKYHPNAKIWVSPQAFKPTKKWYAQFYNHVNKQYPWFGGVVYGPWIKETLEQVKKKINPKIPIRLYPDITHNFSSQYPIPNLDISLAMTLGRESINPRPTDEKFIHNRYAKLAQGSISYSEGTNDDVNKFIWSDQDWNPKTSALETLRDYAKYFIGYQYQDDIAQSILALEKNLRGPLVNNSSVQQTLQQWQVLEKNASVQVLSNPRFQSGLIRAYFDGYIQRRLLYEMSLERLAKNKLESRKKGQTIEAINEAKNILNKAIKETVSPELRERCIALADSLYRSFGAQLTIEKHHAASGRGNFIDNIDIPLNDSPWLNEQLDNILKLTNESERDQAVENILHRADPGPGGFYDNLGSPESWKRIVAKKTWKEDPSSLESPRLSFGVGLTGVDWVHEIVAKGFEGKTTPLAWMNQINTLYETPLEMEYDSLDPEGSYQIRISYTGRFRSSVQLMADGVQIHPFIRMGKKPMVEYPLPTKITKDGKIRLTFTCGLKVDGEGERGTQVAEIWIIKNKTK
jgi:hypothetical protein